MESLLRREASAKSIRSGDKAGPFRVWGQVLDLCLSQGLQREGIKAFMPLSVKYLFSKQFCDMKSVHSFYQ